MINKFRKYSRFKSIDYWNDRYKYGGSFADFYIYEKVGVGK